MPAARTWFLGLNNYYVIHVANLVGFTQFRLIAYVITAGSVSAKLVLTQANNSDMANVSGEGLLAINTTGYGVGSWADINPSAIQNPSYFGIMGEGGDATADPVFAYLAVEFR